MSGQDIDFDVETANCLLANMGINEEDGQVNGAEIHGMTVVLAQIFEKSLDDEFLLGNVEKFL